MALVLPFIVLGGIYSGLFTPTEAAAVSAGRDGITPPPFGLTLFTILLPVILMLMDTVAKLTITGDAAHRTGPRGGS